MNFIIININYVGIQSIKVLSLIIILYKLKKVNIFRPKVEISLVFWFEIINYV